MGMILWIWLHSHSTGFAGYGIFDLRLQLLGPVPHGSMLGDELTDVKSNIFVDAGGDNGNIV